MRHYTNAYIAFVRQDSKLVDTTDFQKAYEYAEDSLYAYNKAYKEAEDSYLSQALSMIGECKLRKILLFHYYNDICNKSKKEFTKHLLNADKKTPKIILDLNSQITEKLEKLEVLQNLYPIDSYSTFQNLYYDCRIKLLELSYRTKLNSFERINNIKEEETVNRVYRAINEDCKSRKEISEIHLEMMIKRYKIQYNKKKESFFSSLFYDLLQAYIHLANKSLAKSKEYNLDQAMNIAREWKRIHKKEPDAFYYCGVLELLKALQDNNNKLLASAKENLDKCFRIYKDMKDPPPPKKFVRTEFLIGKDGGLRGLILYDDSAETDLSRLWEFQGEIKDYTKDYT
jgi:hypothetical protein